MRAASNLFYLLKCCCDYDFQEGSALEGSEDSIPWQTTNTGWVKRYKRIYIQSAQGGACSCVL